MDVNVDNLIYDYLEKINNNYNNDYYFIKNCSKFQEKYSPRISSMDNYLRLFFTENNFIEIGANKFKFCKDSDLKRNITINYL